MISRKTPSVPPRTSQSAPTLLHSPPSTSLPMPPPAPAQTDWRADRPSILLLILLYTAQGLPMGLAFGSIPFLLKERGSTYADLAHFSLASLPYTLKLFIAPIVDSFYSPAFGRRKSWIVPVQLVIGLVATLLAPSIDLWVRSGNVALLTPTFLLLLALAATQDIAVDGWSLTMLRKSNVQYASTCQSLGLSLGFFSTFTIFLAFSNAAFCDGYIRPLLFWSIAKGPLATLQSVLRWSGLYYLLLTLYITIFKQETADGGEEKKTDDVSSGDVSPSKTGVDLSNSFPAVKRSRSVIVDSILATYSDLLIVTRKPAVRSLVVALLVAKVGFSAHDNVSSLKLLDLGFSKESMASMAVIQTPFTMLATIITGRLVAKRSSTEVYLYGYFFRFLISLTGPLCVSFLQSSGGVVTPTFYILVLSLTILYSFASECLMFIGIGAFFLNISSSSVHVAGSYLTLLNTSSNMGGTWHRALVLWLVDQLTWREKCAIPPDAPNGTLCPIVYDGYYVISLALIPVAAMAGVHLIRTLPRLAKLPDSSWKASQQTR